MTGNRAASDLPNATEQCELIREKRRTLYMRALEESSRQLRDAMLRLTELFGQSLGDCAKPHVTSGAGHRQKPHLRIEP